VRRGQPAVVFCNPNAGLYECANSSPKSADWLEFYRVLGFQVGGGLRPFPCFSRSPAFELCVLFFTLSFEAADGWPLSFL
jgi:hypothetical protein